MSIRADDRLEGLQKVTGTAPYVADLLPDRLAHGALVKSTVAAGRVTQLDTAAAEAAPGVLAVITHRNAPRLGHPPTQGSEGGAGGEAGLPLQDNRVRYHGQALGLVVAETLEQATAAAELVGVTYAPEREPAVALRAPQGVEETPAPARVRGDLAAGLDEAAALVSETYELAPEHNNPMEPHGALAEWDDGRLVVHDSTQWTLGCRRVLAAAFGLRVQDVRVFAPFVGGGFGSKARVWPHQLLAAVGARHTGRPVSLVLARADLYSLTGYRPAMRQEIRLGARADGTLTALEHRSWSETSRSQPYLEPAGKLTGSLYAVPNVRTEQHRVRLDRPTPTIMRAPGDAPGVLVLETALDELAERLGIDPLELRTRNHADVEPTSGKPWTSKSLLACYQEGARRFGWSRRAPEPRTWQEGGELVGWGCASAIYPTYASPCAARVTVRDHSAVVELSTQEIGTGNYTAVAQLAAAELGLEPADVNVRIGDTELPPAPSTAGSRSLASLGPAVLAAAREARKSPEGVGSTFHLPVGAEESRRGEVVEGVNALLPWVGPTYAAAAFGAHFCEVRVDRRTCRPRVTRWVGAFAAGRIVNPKLTRSQLLGGIVFGIGQALTEEGLVDGAGRIVNSDLAEYHLPTQADVPDVEVALVTEEDEVVNELGAKGVGELGIVGAGAAVAGAVWHATGRRVRSFPITCDKLL